MVVVEFGTVVVVPGTVVVVPGTVVVVGAMVVVVLIENLSILGDTDEGSKLPRYNMCYSEFFLYFKKPPVPIINSFSPKQCDHSSSNHEGTKGDSLMAFLKLGYEKNSRKQSTCYYSQQDGYEYR